MSVARRPSLRFGVARRSATRGIGRRRALPAALVLFVAIAGSPSMASANPESAALRARASDQIYNLDRDLAIATFREAIAADPQDAAVYRGLASGLWLSITFRRGNMTVDDYLGKVTRPTNHSPAPPAEVAAAFSDALERALTLAH